LTRCLFGLMIVPLISIVAHAAPALENDQSKAEAVLDSAIRACGGEKEVGKLQVVVKVTSATILSGGGTSRGTDYEISWQSPDRIRTEYRFAAAAANRTYIRVFDGDKAWLSLNGTVRELGKSPLTPYGPERSVAFGAELIAFKGKDYKLTALGKVKVDDQEVVGVKVAHEGDHDFTLYFDKDTNLPVKRVVTLPAATPGAKETEIEVRYQDYKESGKIKYASKVSIIRAGRTMEMNVTEFKPVEKLDDSLFKKPE
jgi:outer membrane lipoprotein-sorting protein